MCRTVYQEARDAFFDANIIRLSGSESEDRESYIHLIRHVEITGDTAGIICSASTLQDSGILKYAAFPRVQTVTLDCDELYEAGKTVRAFTGKSKQWAGLRCIDLGIFEVHTSLPDCKVKIFLRYRALTTSLSDALAVVDDPDLSFGNLEFDGLKEAYGHDEHLEDAWVSAKAPYCAVHLVWWLRCYDLLMNGGKPYCDIDFFIRQQCIGTMETPIINESLRAGDRLHDLSLDAHEPALVEWASELLALNIASMQDRIYGGDFQLYPEEENKNWLNKICGSRIFW